MLTIAMQFVNIQVNFSIIIVFMLKRINDSFIIHSFASDQIPYRSIEVTQARLFKV